MIDVFTHFSDWHVPTPFPRIPFKDAMDKFMDKIYIENIWCFSKDKDRDIFKHTKLGTLEEFI